MVVHSIWKKAASASLSCNQANAGHLLVFKVIRRSLQFSDSTTTPQVVSALPTSAKIKGSATYQRNDMEQSIFLRNPTDRQRKKSENKLQQLQNS